MNIFKVAVFHILACVFSCLIVALNFAITPYVDIEYPLYILQFLFTVAAYVWFGAKGIQYASKKAANFINVWWLSFFLLFIFILDAKAFSSLFNVQFQLITSLFKFDSLTQNVLCAVSTILPSLLFQVGKVLNDRRK